MLNIQIRVLERQARRALRDTSNDLRQMRTEADRANGATSGMSTRGVSAMTRFGSQVQWAGRQLQYNFSLPILLAGGAATKFALDNEKAMTRIVKVYGDGERGAEFYSKEVEALGRNFVALSNHFGVNQAEVMQVAGDWAAAGASGVALAKATRLTLETMILGEMEAAKTTEALIAIQAQYGIGVDELSDTIGTLNMVENETGVQMEGLIDSMSRAAGTARTAGVTIQELAAFTAALVPASGSASNAGNALKTIFSRILAPTREAAQVLGEMGINTKALGWQSMTATERLKSLATEFNNLDEAQKTQASTSIASRYQINRFDIMMRDLANTNGYYQKAMEASSDVEANRTQKLYELNKVLDSNPQKLKRMGTIIQNSMAEVIQPLIPWIVYFAQTIATLAQRFTELSPAIQKMVVVALLMLAMVGPVTRYIGAFIILIGYLRTAFFGVTGAITGFIVGLGRIIASPARRVVSLLASMRTGLVALRATALWAGLTGAVTGAFTAIGGGLAAIWRIIAVTMTGAIGATLSVWRTVIVGAFALMRANLTVIWTGTWRWIATMTAAGSGTVTAIFTVMRANIITSFVMMRAGVFAIMAGMWRGLIAGAAVFAAGLRVMLIRGLTAIPLLFSRMGAGILVALRAIGPRLIGFLTGPIGIAITVVATLLLAFKDQIAGVWNTVVGNFRNSAGQMANVFAPLVSFFWKAVDGIKRAFWALPSGITSALIAVVRLVKQAALAVYSWFSWMNPFQRHSPSLVESVTWGMAEIARQYASVGNAGAVFKKAAGDLKEFKRISESLGHDEWADKREDISIAMPSGLGAFNALVGDLKVMNGLLAEQGRLVEQQKIKVDQWQSAVDRASAALDAQQSILDSLKSNLDALTDAYAAHEDAIANYADAPLVGMGEMSDKMFANEMAQKKLRLELLKMGDASKSVDDTRDRMASLQGEIEKLRGTSNDLRAAGAGSDVLGPINAQIKQMEKAYDKMGQSIGGNTGGTAQDELQKQLEKLQREAEILDLENALKFDPLTRQIEKLTDTSKELTFAEITNGIKKEREAMKALQPQIDAATRAHDAQKKAVDAASAAYDAVQARYENERAELDLLQKEYDFTADSIREIEGALNDVSGAASQMIAKQKEAANAAKSSAEALSPGAANFIAAEGANFPIDGGKAAIGREGGIEDQSAAIDELTTQLANETAAAMGAIDMFGPIREKWNQFTGWWSSTVVPKWGEFTGWFATLFQGVGLSGFGDQFSKIWDGFKTGWDKVKGVWDSIVDLFGPQISEIWRKIKEGVKTVTDELSEEFGSWAELVEPFQAALSNAWDVIRVAAVVAFGIITAVVSTAFSMIGNIIRPLIETIGGVFKGLLTIVRGTIKGVLGIFNGLVDFLRGIFMTIKALFTGDWDGIGRGIQVALDGIKHIFSSAIDGIFGILEGLATAIGSIIKGGLEIAWGIVSGFVEGIVDFFKWLYDVLVGHSIVPDLVNAVTKWFQNMKDWVIEKVKAFVGAVIQWFKDLYTNLKNRVLDIYNAVTGKFSALWTALKTTVQNIYNSINNKFIETKNAMANRVSEAYTSVTGKFSSLWTWLKNIVLNIYNSINGKFTEIKNAMANRISEAYTSVTGKFSSIKSGVEGTVNTFRNNIADKFANIRDTMLGAFNYVKDKVGGVFNNITSSIKSGVNSGITAINKLISGLNKVAEVLPGLDWNIALIPKLAQGGAIPNQRVGGGFATNKARAIVGEGSNTHKEYVIPTDPKYRKRAVSLLQGAASDMGIATDDPGLGFGTGGWGILGSMLGGAKDLLKEGADWVKTTAQGAVSTVFRPFKDAALGLADGIPWNFGKKTAKSGINNLWDWATGSDEAFRQRGNEAVEIQKAAEAAKRKWSRPMTAYRLSSPFGFRKHPITGVTKLHAGMDMAAPSGTNIYAAAAGNLTRFMSNVGLGNHVKIDHGAGIRTQYGHMSSFVGDNRMVQSGELIGKVGSTGASTGPHLHFEVYNMGIPIDPRPFMAARGAPLAEALSVGSRPGMAGGPGKYSALATGGIVRARPGGIMANIGEGRHDEAVIPLPSGWQGMMKSAVQPSRSVAVLQVQRLIVNRVETREPQTLYPTASGDTYIENHFHGDLSFPNVKDEKDVDGFMRNLKNLGGGSNR